MYSLSTDIYLTRRRRFHFIHDENDELVWSGASVYAALRWLYHQDQYEFQVLGDGPSLILKIVCETE